MSENPGGKTRCIFSDSMDYGFQAGMAWTGNLRYGMIWYHKVRGTSVQNGQNMSKWP